MSAPASTSSPSAPPPTGAKAPAPAPAPGPAPQPQDWRKQLNLPQKDTRPQTEVSRREANDGVQDLGADLGGPPTTTPAL